MSNLLRSIMFFLCAPAFAAPCFAVDGCGPEPGAKSHSLSLAEANELLRGVGEVKKVSVSPINGLWLLELEKDGRQAVVFMDFEKKNLIAGTVFPLAAANTAKPEATYPLHPVANGGWIDAAKIPLEHSVLMGNSGGEKRLFVFTDTDCPFCSKMHDELKKLVLSEPDLAVYIKVLPLKIHPAAYDKARVILAKSSLELLEQAFAGKKLPAPGEKDLAAPVDETIRYADSVGITGTPTLVLPNGRVVMGLIESGKLQKLLGTGEIAGTNSEERSKR